MSNMNSALTAWQLTIMAVVPVLALVGWIVTIFIVAREPARPEVPAARPASPVIAVARRPAGPAVVGQDEPARPAKDRVAA
jgi:hypothetical protein